MLSQQRKLPPLNSSFWKLPTQIRRLIMITLYRRRYLNLSRWCTGERSGYSFLPFFATRTLFVHIPKTAGVSIATALYGNLGGGHIPYRLYEMLFARSELASLFSFAFVRNPWDRLFSAYTFLKAGGMNEQDKSWGRTHLACIDDFHTFVTSWLNSRNAYSYHHFVPQFEYLIDAHGKIGVDFVGRFEALHTDLREIILRAGLNASMTLDRQNKSEKKHFAYKQAYDARSAAVVATVYERDIELFRYEF